MAWRNFFQTQNIILVRLWKRWNDFLKGRKTTAGSKWENMLDLTKCRSFSMVNTTISDRVCGMGYGSPFMVMLIAGFVVFFSTFGKFFTFGGEQVTSPFMRSVLEFPCCLQWLTEYLILTLVFMWNSELSRLATREATSIYHVYK